MTRERLAFFKMKMMKHDVEDGTAIVVLSAAELYELLQAIETKS